MQILGALMGGVEMITTKLRDGTWDMMMLSLDKPKGPLNVGKAPPCDATLLVSTPIAAHQCGKERK